MQPKSKQLEINAEEKQALRLMVRDQWKLASADLERRNNANRRWMQLWRSYQETGSFNEQENSNFRIPLTQWQVLAKLAKELDALLGEESEIVVRPVGPSDAATAPKVSRYMNWRVKQSLKLFKTLYDYLLQKIVLGTTMGILTWKTETRTVRRFKEEPIIEQVPSVDPVSGLPVLMQQQVGTQQVEEEIEVPNFDGPCFQLENIEDIVVPPNAKDADTCAWIARKLRLSVDELLQMSDEGKLYPLKGKELERLRKYAETGNASDEAPEGDSGQQVTKEKRAQSGLPSPEGQQTTEQKLVVINWIGKWRKKSARPEDRAQDIVVYYQPDLEMLLGASRLVDHFPDGRRPFIKSELVRDIGGGFWGIGLPEFLESINREMDVQHNAITDASVYALGPLIVYEPAAGFNPQSFKYEPFTTLPVADASKVKSINMGNVNLGPYVAVQSQLLGFAERLSGLTEAELGRPFAQPNAPRTLGQQQIIAAGSGVRLLMDLRLERESIRELLKRIWELDKRFAPKPIFFRVSESTELEQIALDEMGDYDFDIGPLTSTANKFQELQYLLQAYALNLQNPVAAQNPAILAAYLRKINTKLGQEEINALIPDYMQMKPPRNPEEENADLLKGLDVDPNPMDNHVAHIAKHSDLLERVQQEFPIGMGAEGKPQMATIATLNPGIVGRIQSHISEHEQVMSQMGGISMGGMSPFSKPANSAQPTDQTGQANDPMNALKGLLNSGGQNIA